MIYTYDPIRPDEAVGLKFDLTNLLTDDDGNLDPIVNATVSHAIRLPGQDAPSGNSTLQLSPVLWDDTSVRFMVADGVNATTYALTFHVETAAGQQRARTGFLSVREGL